MKRWFAVCAALGLGVALGTGALAGDDKSEGKKDSAKEQTIRGVIGGVTAEGEMEVDYRTKQAVLVEADFLTVIGSPAGASESGRRHRHNVYVVAITPRTKVYQAVDESGKSTEKKEASLDALEVGDHIELQFQPVDDSNTRAGSRQTDRMRTKHGRHRTYFGSAREVTVLPAHHEDKASDKSDTKSDKSDTKSDKSDTK